MKALKKEGVYLSETRNPKHSPSPHSDMCPAATPGMAFGCTSDLWEAYRDHLLGTPVVPFCPLCLGISFIKLSSRKKGTLIVNGLLRNLVLAHRVRLARVPRHSKPGSKLEDEKLLRAEGLLTWALGFRV